MSTQTISPQRLYLMQVGYVPPNNMPFVCYLVQMTDGTNILIDSGLPDPDPNMPRPPGREPPVFGKDVIEQLDSIGIKPADIKLMVCTHFDLDHCGHQEAFTNAQYIVQRTHYDKAINGHPRFVHGRPHWDQPVSRYRFVDGDTELFPGLRLIETSGHTSGHQSVLVHLPESGAIVLAIDAVRQQERFIPDVQAVQMDEDEALLRASTKKLIDLAQKEKASLIVFGHDGQQWPTLKKLPEFYS